MLIGIEVSEAREAKRLARTRPAVPLNIAARCFSLLLHACYRVRCQRYTLVLYTLLKSHAIWYYVCFQAVFLFMCISTIFLFVVLAI